MADRVQNYNLQTPLTANDLNRQRDFDLIALGKMFSALIGTTMVAEGLAATAVAVTTVPTVQLADGQLWELGTLDPTAFGSLSDTAFPSTQQVMKQGLLLSARGDVNTFQLTPPGTSGESVVYLLEAQYADADENIQTVTLYNVSDPSAPTTQSLPRQRWGTINFTLKVGAAATSPVAPTADAGYVPLYAIEVAYGQTVLSQSNITVASGAPFLTQKLFALMNESAPLTIAPATASGQAVNLGQFISSFAGNGYFKFPNGLIIQWGTTTTSTSGYINVAFPLAFPTACTGMGTTFQSTGLYQTSVNINSVNTSNFNLAGVQSGAYASQPITWIAIGY